MNNRIWLDGGLLTYYWSFWDKEDQAHSSPPILYTDCGKFKYDWLSDNYTKVGI